MERSYTVANTPQYRLRLLPVFEDGVSWRVVGDVIWGGTAGLYKQPGVIDGRRGLDLHVDLSPEVKFQRVLVGVDHLLEAAVRIELGLVGEGAKALLHHCDVVPVCCKAQGHVSVFGILAIELHLQLVHPGDQTAGVVHGGDLVSEVEEVLVLLQSATLFTMPCCQGLHIGKRS